MKNGHKKYMPFPAEPMAERKWPSRTLTAAPVWCSVDLRDGNQAMPNPMTIEDKLEFFNLLVGMGFKEIEVGFPSASDTEFNVVRTLIDDGLIPDDVTIQVLVQAREHLIRRTFEAVRGAKNVILHFYNNCSELHRRVVFNTDLEGVTAVAVEAAQLIKRLADEECGDTNIRFEYSPESFSKMKTSEAVYVCDKVLTELGATAEKPVIINLPATVERCMPNQYADEIERFIATLPNRDRAIISIHPHNDRGTGVAAAELGMLAGAQRVEGTLFGNGERTGNLDLVAVAMNLYSQGVDPKLDFSDINAIRSVYERCTGMVVHDRHPYAGSLVFTAFSGSHQDAIDKGFAYLRENGADYWDMPYLPIDPADVGRKYEQIIRINSQSGKGGAAFLMEDKYGFKLPRAMRADFGAAVQHETDKVGRELAPQRIYDLFMEEYANLEYPYRLVKHSFEEKTTDDGHSHVKFTGTLSHKDTSFTVSGEGNGPIDAFFNAIHGQKIDRFSFVDYSEHAISDGSDSRAVAYIHLRSTENGDLFGVGISHNINLAPLRGIISAINRAARETE